MQALRQPATAILVVVCCAVWYLLHKHSLGYPDVGMSYDNIVQAHELWRMASSQLSHVDLLHLVFNVSALWSIGIVEKMGPARGLGTLYYLQQSALLFVLSPVVRSGSVFLHARRASCCPAAHKPPQRVHWLLCCRSAWGCITSRSTWPSERNIGL
jgi:membrane associated rhomboid family serine protease